MGIEKQKEKNVIENSDLESDLGELKKAEIKEILKNLKKTKKDVTDYQNDVVSELEKSGILTWETSDDDADDLDIAENMPADDEIDRDEDESIESMDETASWDAA